MKEIETVYFFVKLAIKNEVVTPATRFSYFLVSSWGNPDSYEIEMKANKKIYKIAALVSQRDKTTYEVAHVDTVSTDEYNVLKKHFPTYDYQRDMLLTTKTADGTDGGEEKDE